LDRNGARTTVVSGLPSATDGPLAGSTVIGVAAVQFVDDQLEALIAGAGCSHGNPNTFNSLVRVNSNGSTTRLANLSAFLASHPVANPDPSDEEPDGTWFSMFAVGHRVFAVEPNHQELVRIRQNGRVKRVVDFSTTFVPKQHNWQGPTSIARMGDDLLVGTLAEFPIVPGSAQVLRVDPRTGHFGVFASGLTTVLGLAVDRDGSLYVSEASDAAGLGPQPGAGKILRIKNGQRTVIASSANVPGGLNVPTGLAIGPDHNLYVAANSFGAPAGAGVIVRIPLEPRHDEYDHDDYN
jgi:hypothetical protein